MTGVIVLFLRILAIALLYGFLGWALYTIWSELRFATVNLSARQTPEIKITNLDADDIVGKIFHTNEIIIGRDNNCDFILSDEIVSARHTRLSYHHKQWWVEDLQSTNGTYLNEERIYTSTVIISGDELRCGKINLLITINIL